MLQFAVFDDSGPAPEWPLHNARLLDRDDLVVPGDISFADGIITCQRRGVRPTALMLLHDAGEAGHLALQTCLLPHSEEPYILSVELARHRIAVFLAQAESWQMHLSAEHPSMEKLETARRIFTRAMVERDDRQADAYGREALQIAIEASEHLSLAHAEILLHKRFAERPASRAALGTSIWPERDGAALRDFCTQQFELVRIPMEWGLLCPREGVYDWGAVDRWMEWAVESNRMVIAGPLLNFNPGRMPAWIDPGMDFGALCDRAYDHVQLVVQRYGDNVGMYSVVSGVNTNMQFRMTLKQMGDLVRTLALVVRQGQRMRRVMVDLSHLWGEYLADDRDGVAPITFIEQLIQSGIRLDAVGIQMLFGDTSGGMATRDLLEISRLLDRYLHLERKIIVSGVGVPDSVCDADAGWWHSPWSLERQGRWGGQVLPLLLSKPFIEAVVWADLYDHLATVPRGAGLLNAEGRPKPVLKKLGGLKQRLTRPLGKIKAPEVPQ
ncbi:MAG: endo-1,4-beta-xylanase [Phycisphaerales bacterium]|nr:endo-1,4-beta-xylanase [Phycisphaerales bacterium]